MISLRASRNCLYLSGVDPVLIRIFYQIVLFGTLLSLAPVTTADVVRPALVEINVNTDGTYRVEVRASIEALLTGINAKYKNTQDSPMAEEYDALRVLVKEKLAEAFVPFQSRFAEVIELRFDGERVPLKVTDVDIPEPGYTKVPRISVIALEGAVDRTVTSLDWYYPASFGDNAVRVRQVDEVNEKWHWSQWQWIRDDERSEPFSLVEVFSQPSIGHLVTTYMVSGFEHILPKGLDHILFILGIFLLSLHFKPLLWQVTMFTIAHTITLGLSASGYISLPENIVQPLIALSIAYVGIENLWHKSLHNSRLVLVFAFGLLHGIGFAGMLREFGMPDEDFLAALISFNIGVELGQLAVILMAFAVVGWLRHREYYRYAVIIPGSLAISVIGLYWTVDRVSLV